MLIDFKFYVKIENSKSQAKVTGENVHVVHITSSQLRPRSGSGGRNEKTGVGNFVKRRLREFLGSRSLWVLDHSGC